MPFEPARFRAITILLGCCLLASVCNFVAAQDAKEGTTDKADVKADDRYAVPDGDSAALLKFITDLKQIRPKTLAEYKEFQQKAPAAILEAARKILDLEEDPDSALAKKARVLVLQARVQKISDASADEQRAILSDVAEALSSAERLTRDHLQLAFGTAQGLERAGNRELAAEAYTTFGKSFSALDDPALQKYGEKMVGAARRVQLPGHTMKIEGQTVSGKEFDWESYRGKVVLVDFWATWCGPCIQELPNVKKNYERYHDKGFDVVGISLDKDSARLESFLKREELPWVTLFEEGAGWDHSMATYYGIMAIPAVILVDREGKVVSMNARGSQLDRELARLLGPPATDES